MAITTSYSVMNGVIVLLVTIMVSAYLFMTRKFNYWKNRGVFEVKPLPFFGNIMDMVFLKQSGGFLMRDLYNRAKTESYIGFYMFDKPCLLIRDRRIIQDILIKDFNYFCNHYCNSDPKDSLGCSNLLLMRNPTWKIVRTKLTPIFSSGKLKKMFELLMECTINLDRYCDSLGLNDKEKAVNVKDLIGNLTTDMIGSTAYGLNIDSINNPQCAFRKSGKAIFHLDIYRSIELFIIFYYPSLSRLFGTRFFSEKSNTFLRKTFWNTINRRMESGEKRGDLIDILIDFKREYANRNLENFELDGDGLVAQASIFFSAGFETSSSTVSFTLYEIAVQPKIQDKLRKEIFDAFKENDGKITYEMVLSLKYLHMVISETLRKYPTLTILDRETVQSYKITDTDLVIEKGTPIFISLLGLHYDPEYFPDPEKYDPERFNEENIHKIAKGTYMPFGTGPRKCIGYRLGFLQTKLSLVKILSQYEVTSCEKTMIPMVIDTKSIVTTPVSGEIWLNLRKIIIIKMAIITSYWIMNSIMIAIITTVVAAYLFMTRKFNYWKKRGVFEIKPSPFMGNFADCIMQKRSPGFIMKNLYNQANNQPYVGFYIFDKPCLLIRDPEILKNILVKDFNYFSNRYSSTSKQDSLGSSSILLLKNPAWKMVRNKLTPIFTSGKLKKMFEVLMKTVANLDSYLNKMELDGKGKVMDLKDLCGNLTTDMTGNNIYGLDIDSINNPKCEFREKGKAIFELSTFRGLEFLMIFFYPAMSRYINLNLFGKESSVFLRKIFWDTINHRIKSGQNRGDLIDILIDFRKKYNNQDLEDFNVNGDDLVAQAAIFFTGGFETSSSAMSFSLYELAMQPKLQDKLRKEINDAIDENGGKLTYDMVLSLPYLDMVIFETLRMYPILTVLDRETVEPYKMPNSDLILEKDTPVFISVLGMSYDPQYFPNPDKYDPERFSEENIHKIRPYVYLPFGEGPRKCIGSRLGLLQTKLGIIQILSKYEVTPCKDTPTVMVIDPKSQMSMPLNGKIYLNVRKLNTNVK
ncbi:PREDICTED: uncharacterized protein LOC106747956 [Dinoponera quadriceps]|uniref:Uncharacterized protein LOC106747956 n=1 Tax=Dinoponera quadriceps TaxID=609295 RepID=A0A6P3XTY6_DINQU|nr:PREDICTED: uncharacterized protein LOC106747956 [Dinoponera quadriceps]